MANFTKVVVCEKPSVARDIAKHLNAKEKHEGYLCNDEWAVTWAFGHLVELKDPHDYQSDWKPWKVEKLPMIPEKFKLRPRADKGVREQLKIIGALFKQAEEIVCATDAGREGELIFRYILQHLRATSKPVKRLWVSSLTEEAIAQGFEKLKDADEFDHLYQAARCRSEADWIVGLNATRFYTVMHGGAKQLWSIGRVQTPVLAMVVERDREIAKFVPKDYWELHTRFEGVLFKLQLKDEKGKLTTRQFETLKSAEELKALVSSKVLEVLDKDEREELVSTPSLYDLTELQKDMNRRFGMSADQTLQAAQSLYEKKHITYPRTDSKFISSDLSSSIEPLLKSLKAVRKLEVETLDLEKLPVVERLVNDLKVTDHHAILPTKVIPQSRMSQDEIYVYHSVVMRLIAALSEPGVKKRITLTASVGGEIFKASATFTHKKGWQALYEKKGARKSSPKEAPNRNAESEAEEHSEVFHKILAIDRGSSGSHDPLVKDMKTKAPQLLTEASLLQMMESAGRQVKAASLREAIKEKGIGTPATRASIIETLLSRRYLQRKSKKIVSTDKGRELISLLKTESLKSARLTAEWEDLLAKIEDGKYSPTEFMQGVKKYTEEIVGFSTLSGDCASGWGPCPKCGSPVIEGTNAYGCSKWKEGCDFVLAKEYKGTVLPDSVVCQLLRLNQSPQALLLKDDEQTYFAKLSFDGNNGLLETQCEEPDEYKEAQKLFGKKKTVGACPLCSSPVTSTAKSFGCSRWKQGCKFVVWKKIAGRKIEEDVAKILIEKGKTEKLEGFKSKAGEKFSASLTLEKGEVKFSF